MVWFSLLQRFLSNLIPAGLLQYFPYFTEIEMRSRDMTIHILTVNSEGRKNKKQKTPTPPPPHLAQADFSNMYQHESQFLSQVHHTKGVDGSENLDPESLQ